MLQENPPLESGVPAILIKNGTFSWEPNAGHPTLSNINLEIEVGSLVAIVEALGREKLQLFQLSLKRSLQFLEARLPSEVQRYMSPKCHGSSTQLCGTTLSSFLMIH